MPSSHLILCCPLLLLPPTPPSIRVFSNESNLYMRWPKCWSFSFSISSSNEYPGLNNCRRNQFSRLLNSLNMEIRMWLLKIHPFSVNVHCVFFCCCIGLLVSDILVAGPGLLRKIKHHCDMHTFPAPLSVGWTSRSCPQKAAAALLLCPWNTECTLAT